MINVDCGHVVHGHSQDITGHLFAQERKGSKLPRGSHLHHVYFDRSKRGKEIEPRAMPRHRQAHHYSSEAEDITCTHLFKSDLFTEAFVVQALHLAKDL